MQPVAVSSTLERLHHELRRGPQIHVMLGCPGHPALHPRHAQIQTHSIAWARAFGLVDDSQLPRLERARIAWLPARAYPRGSAAALEIAADWTTLFCLLDDRIEREASPTIVARTLAGLAAMFDPHAAPTASDPMQRACADLRDRVAAAGPGRLDQLRGCVQALFAAFMTEARTRASGTIPELDAYLRVREQTVGLHVEFALGEIVEAIDLSPAQRESPERVALAALASDLVGWANDIYTHEKELVAGETHNLVFVLAHAGALSLPAAVARAVAMHDAAMLRFMTMSARLGDHPAAPLRRYAAMLRAWVRGHLDWGRETGRYGAEMPVPTDMSRRTGGLRSSRDRSQPAAT